MHTLNIKKHSVKKLDIKKREIKTCEGFTRIGKKCLKLVKIGDTLCYIHKKHFIQEKPTECVICLSSLVKQRKPLKCGHWIHKNCIIRSAKAECPICRTPLIFSIRDTKRLNKYAIKHNNEQQQMQIIDDENLANDFATHTILSPAIQTRINQVLQQLISQNTTEIDFNQLLQNIFDDATLAEFLENIIEFELTQ